MYSLTQLGNVGQAVSMLLVIIGMGKDEADAAGAALTVVIGAVAYVVSFVAAWYGRYRVGGVSAAGFRKK